jgi:hypothetical protein
MGILDTIITTRQHTNLQEFKPEETLREIFSLVEKERDRVILRHRYGLENAPEKTLAAIGQEHNLTRERVRQIEKDIIRHLKKNAGKSQGFVKAKEFLLGMVAEHGRIIAEENLLLRLNLQTVSERNSVLFLLHLIEELDNFIHDNYKKSWVYVLFNNDLMHGSLEESKKILKNHGKPLASEEFLKHFKQTEFYIQNQAELTDQVILNFLSLALEIEKNVFEEWGLADWKEIKPKDVGDKAYLVMKNHKKSEHYGVITEMINKAGFDNRTAYKETVHNELIKDPRFVLVGRGIYGLSEWGYKPGVVADVIKEILQASPEPLPREKIIEEVLKRRMVKKNTILVGLSNKKQFKKVGRNLYALV